MGAIQVHVDLEKRAKTYAEWKKQKLNDAKILHQKTPDTRKWIFDKLIYEAGLFVTGEELE